MNEIGKTFIILGIFILIIGLGLTFSGKIPFLGKLPGDIFIQKNGFSFYFPIVTSIIISIILSIIIGLFK